MEVGVTLLAAIFAYDRLMAALKANPVSKIAKPITSNSNFLVLHGKSAQITKNRQLFF